MTDPGCQVLSLWWVLDARSHEKNTRKPFIKFIWNSCQTWWTCLLQSSQAAAGAASSALPFMAFAALWPESSAFLFTLALRKSLDIGMILLISGVVYTNRMPLLKYINIYSRMLENYCYNHWSTKQLLSKHCLSEWDQQLWLPFFP